MREGYQYACLWDDGAGSSCLAIEYVMTNAGPVILGVLYDGSDGELIARRVVGWFYEEALPILRERGLGQAVRNTFTQKKAFRDERLKVVLMFRKRTFLFPEPVKKSKESGSGRFGEEGVLQIPEQGYLLTSADLCKAVSKEEFYRFLGKDGIGEKDAALQELGRRARVRNRSGSYAAVWIGR